MANEIEQIRELDKELSLPSPDSINGALSAMGAARIKQKKSILATKLADKADKLLEALEEINQYECIEWHDTIAEQAIKDFKDGE